MIGTWRAGPRPGSGGRRRGTRGGRAWPLGGGAVSRPGPVRGGALPGLPGVGRANRTCRSETRRDPPGPRPAGVPVWTAVECGACHKTDRPNRGEPCLMSSGASQGDRSASTQQSRPHCPFGGGGARRSAGRTAPARDGAARPPYPPAPLLSAPHLRVGLAACMTCALGLAVVSESRERRPSRPGRAAVRSAEAARAASAEREAASRGAARGPAAQAPPTTPPPARERRPRRSRRRPRAPRHRSRRPRAPRPSRRPRSGRPRSPG